MDAKITLPDDFWVNVEHFTTILLKYNQTHNITGAKSEKAVLANVKDSIYPLQFLDTTTLRTAIDIGTGAGFPGLLLALALPDVMFTLFEPIAKKSAFLHLVKMHLSMTNVTIFTQRVEQVSPWETDLITSRAVTNTKMLINLCKGFITPKSTVLFYKGEYVDEEVKGLQNYTIHQKDKRHYLIMKDIDAF